MADKKISALTSAATPLAGTEVLPIVQSGATVKATAENIFNTTQPSGNANGIVYLDGSKRATTATNFFYNGTNLGINTTSVTAVFGKTVQLGDGTGNNTLSMVASGGGGFLANIGSAFNLTGRGGTTLAFGTNDVDRVAIDLTGNTTLIAGNLIIGTSGKGIDFSATPGTGTSELLADYEEGTWTPNQGVGLTVVGAFSSSGTYTKVGRLVTLNGFLAGATTIAVSAAGQMFTNAPFTAGLTCAGVIAGFSGVGTSAGYISNGSTTMSSNQAIGASTFLFFNLTYSV
jgi:hypothetical protein